MTTLTYQTNSQARWLVSPASFDRARRGARGVVFGSGYRPCEYGPTLHLQLPIVTNTSFLTLTNTQQRARFSPLPHLTSETLESVLAAFAVLQKVHHVKGHAVLLAHNSQRELLPGPSVSMNRHLNGCIAAL